MTRAVAEDCCSRGIPSGVTWQRVAEVELHLLRRFVTLHLCRKICSQFGEVITEVDSCCDAKPCGVGNLESIGACPARHDNEPRRRSPIHRPYPLNAQDGIAAFSANRNKGIGKTPMKSSIEDTQVIRLQ